MDTGHFPNSTPNLQVNSGQNKNESGKDLSKNNQFRWEALHPPKKLGFYGNSSQKGGRGGGGLRFLLYPFFPDLDNAGVYWSWFIGFVDLTYVTLVD